MSKRLVVCSDGTWGNELDPTPTNVVFIRRALIEDDSQLVFYNPGVASSGGKLFRYFAGALGIGLPENVKDVYRWLAKKYEPGDRIYLLGFSRGAFTVRSAAGMIRKCGLLKKAHLGLVDKAFHIYGKRDAIADTPEARRFRTRYSHEPVPIEFVGVWDTVGSLGVPMNAFRWFNLWMFKFHNVELSRSVHRAYQAVAIDEKRKSFTPTLWKTHPAAPESQFVEQVWFAGCHSNVGGGEDVSGLSDTAFHWMAERAKEAGLTFNQSELDKRLPDPVAGINESLKSFYLYLGRHIRPIGRPEFTGQSVHEAVKKRYERRMDYDPVNLRNYLKRNGLQWKKRPTADPQPTPATTRNP